MSTVLAPSSSRSACAGRAPRAAGRMALPSIRARRSLQVRALLGPDGRPDSGTDTKAKKVLSRENEPEQYWTSKSEAAGANPMADPMAIVGVLGIFFPFILLGIAIAAGVIDISVYR